MRFKDHLLGTDLYDDPEIIKIFVDFEDEANLIEQRAKKNTKVSKKEDNCFIATATLDDINHPYVYTLRQYRDSILSQSSIGKIFISIYYFLSPSLAKLISRNQALKDISLKCIVLPAYNKAISDIKNSEIHSD